MRPRSEPQQYDLYSRPPLTPRTDAAPLANQAAAIVLLGELLYEIVQAETTAATTRGGDEQNHR